jgi:hypothetical protein
MISSAANLPKALSRGRFWLQPAVIWGISPKTTSRTMTAIAWLEIVALGIILGALGQGARTIVGLKKLNDYANDTNPWSALIDGMRLLISFGIGSVAGAFAAITLITDLTKVLPEQLFAIAAAGYAGSDFIEGFITRISGGRGNAPKDSSATSTKDFSDDAVG